MLDTDKCKKCTVIRYSDKIESTQNGLFPRRYYWQSWRAINVSPRLIAKVKPRKDIRMGDNPYLAVIYYSHWNEDNGDYITKNKEKANVDHVFNYSLVQDESGYG